MKRQWISLLLAAGMITGSIPALAGNIPVCAADVSQPEETPESYSYAGVTYALYTDHARVVSVVPKVKIEVQAEIEGRPVTEVGEDAFARWAIISEITLPDSVTVIGKGAFSHLNELTKVTLPQGLTSLPEDCFDDCPALTDITLPDTVEQIGNSCFTNCTSLQFSKLPDLLTTIGDYAFMGCTSQTEFTLPQLLTSIGKSAFVNCHSLTYIGLPDSLESIGDYAFQDCAALENIAETTLIDPIDPSVSYPYFRNLKSVGKNAFNGTAWMDMQPDGVVYLCNAAVAFKGTIPEDATVRLMDGTTVLADGLLQKKGLMQKIILPDSVQYIGNYALQNTGLTEITLPQDLRSIGNFALSNTSLSEIHIPFHTESISQNFASGCSELETITVAEDNPHFTCYDGVLYNAELTQFITAPKMIRQCRIPDTVTSLPQGAFYGCTALESVTLPENLETMGPHCFMKCSALQSITLPASLKKVDFSTFEDCTSLEKVHFSYGLTEICGEAFTNTALKDVRLPDSVTTLGIHAFSNSALTNLVLSEGIETLESEYVEIVFDFPFGTDEAASDPEYPWTAPGDPVPAWNDSAFSGTDLKTITFSNTLKTIEDGIFDNSIPSEYSGYAPIQLTDVYFYGSQSDWDAISIGERNDGLLTANIHISEGTEHSGDVNWDGELTVADCVMLQKFLLGQGNLTNKLAGDLNGDGKTNIFDLVLLKRQVSSLK